MQSLVRKALILFLQISVVSVFIYFIYFVHCEVFYESAGFSGEPLDFIDHYRVKGELGEELLESD